MAFFNSSSRPEFIVFLVFWPHIRPFFMVFFSCFLFCFFLVLSSLPQLDFLGYLCPSSFFFLLLPATHCSVLFFISLYLSKFLPLHITFSTPSFLSLQFLMFFFFDFPSSLIYILISSFKFLFLIFWIWFLSLPLPSIPVLPLTDVFTLSVKLEK